MTTESDWPGVPAGFLAVVKQQAALLPRERKAISVAPDLYDMIFDENRADKKTLLPRLGLLDVADGCVGVSEDVTMSPGSWRLSDPVYENADSAAALTMFGILGRPAGG